ncbi:cysteine protease StiP domain-containing protein [Oceaniglobus ichthyenteri]|uniref:cysteine protease StiP domain-containing protein n=1 Tax=Oceaniglobus ichthyenteri TaxID=2136177 RepID=UPI000D38FF71|nr:cysteine protease StiP domain-containing protein [Oceaniglobus ichthyenteri]
MAGLPQVITGSYNPDDVTFLLKPVQITPTDIALKERLIQSGTAHYSEMISQERRPDARYLQIFQTARANGVDRIAREISALARRISDRVVGGTLGAQITLCSLVRAGVPYGVLLQRELTALGHDCCHFGVSIIRDRGLDRNAMAFIFDRRAQDGIIFVDGWTGKGAIATELQNSWHDLTGRADAELAVLADPSGFATMAGSHDDWLIPSGILGANISGLISRSILNSDVIGPGDFHGSVSVDHLADIDLSLEFVDQITTLMAQYRDVPVANPHVVSGQKLQTRALATVNAIAAKYDVRNLNRIKPGIAEATRAVLRRRPKMVFLRALNDPDLEALIHLCRTDGIDMVEDASLTGPYRAVTLIEKVA